MQCPAALSLASQGHRTRLCEWSWLRSAMHQKLDAECSMHPLQNRKNTSGRMELKKYNKYLKRHTVHKEIK